MSEAISTLLSVHAASLRAHAKALIEQADNIERTATSQASAESTAQPLPDMEVPAGVAAQALGISVAAFQQRVRRRKLPAGHGPAKRRRWWISQLRELRD